MKNRIAFISEHASPLASPGGIDSGGQNVYVAELAFELAKKGYEIDVLPDAMIMISRNAWPSNLVFV